MSREDAIATIRRIENKRKGPFSARIDVDSLPTKKLVHLAHSLSEQASCKRRAKRCK